MKSYLQFLEEETNQEYVLRQREKLPKETLRKIDRQRKLGVPKELIDKYIQDKIKERENQLKRKYFRTTLKGDQYVKIADDRGIQFFMERNDPILHTPTLIRIKRYIPFNVDALMKMRDILPIRKPRVVIKELTEKIGQVQPAGYYQDRIIYIDPDEFSNPDYLIHEYAHYLVDMIPKQTEKMLLDEYRKFIDSYFRLMKRKKTYDLEDTKKENREKLRVSVAKKLGLPSPYSAYNHDELFAEIITHWKRIPNNRASYKFKQAMKKVLTRL